MPATDSSQLILPKNHKVSGSTSWKCPSNIALVKYWGKSPVQIPKNPSISFTLSKAYTQTELRFAPREMDGTSISLKFEFEGKENASFEKRIREFLTEMTPLFPFLIQFDLKITSSNSFPHSSGIASSASAMSALAMCLCDMERQLFKTFKREEGFRQKASTVARLGSGSASRSIFSIASVWGQCDWIEGSADEYAIPFGDQIHPIFRTFKDSILIASSEEKKVSSSAGHELMEHHIFKDVRISQANDHMIQIVEAMKTGNLELFGSIVESEAMTLHALMMTSHPSYILMKPSTIEMIERIKKFRADHHIPVYNTLDAGPNIHLLYPADRSMAVKAFIESELLPLCENRYWIDDEVGVGPVKLAE